MDKKTKTTLGWILIGLGALFLIAGLVVLVTVSLAMDAGAMADPLPAASIWSAIMDFLINLLKLEWSPMRAGIFLTLVGLVLEAGGVYVLIADPKKKK